MELLATGAEVAVAVGGTDVNVGGIYVAVGGMDVNVGGIYVAVGGTTIVVSVAVTSGGKVSVGTDKVGAWDAGAPTSPTITVMGAEASSPSALDTLTCKV
ncbi:MAG: hypothetical protein Kow002_10430 [Anaerolineales bacterium]